jgi:excinuclease ABC subunit C
MLSHFHRDKRSKRALKSALDDIKGIGPKTKEMLIKRLSSVKKIKNSEISALTEVVGTAKAKIIYEYFHAKEDK